MKWKFLLIWFWLWWVSESWLSPWLPVQYPTPSLHTCPPHYLVYNRIKNQHIVRKIQKKKKKYSRNLWRSEKRNSEKCASYYMKQLLNEDKKENNPMSRVKEKLGAHFECKLVFHSINYKGLEWSACQVHKQRSSGSNMGPTASFITPLPGQAASRHMLQTHRVKCLRLSGLNASSALSNASGAPG